MIPITGDEILTFLDWPTTWFFLPLPVSTFFVGMGEDWLSRSASRGIKLLPEMTASFCRYEIAADDNDEDEEESDVESEPESKVPKIH